MNYFIFYSLNNEGNVIIIYLKYSIIRIKHFILKQNKQQKNKIKNKQTNKKTQQHDKEMIYFELY